MTDPGIASPGLSGSGGLLPVSCESCRRKKRKCDRVLPACGNCSRHNIECVLPDVASASPSSIHGQKRLPKGYVEILESRVEQLRATVAKRQSELEAILRPTSPLVNDGVAQPRAAGAHLSMGNDDSVLMTSGSESRAEQSENNTSTMKQGNSLLTTESVISLSRMGESNSTGLMTYSTVLSALLHSDGSDPFVTSRTDSLLLDTSPETVQAFSAVAVQIISSSGLRLLDLYKSNMHCMYPFLDVQRTRNRLDLCIESKSLHEPVQEGEVNGCAFGLVSLLLVLAIGLLFDPKRNQSQKSMLASHLFFMAVNQLETVLAEGTALEEVQALLLFTIYSTYVAAAGSSYQLIGLAMRQCISRGYHNPAENSPKSSTGRKPEQGVRATFWSCYLLERQISWTLDRPTVLENADIFIQLPPIVPNNKNASLRHLIGIYWITAEYLEGKSSTDDNLAIKRLRSLHDWYKNRPEKDGVDGHAPGNGQDNPRIPLQMLDKLYLSSIIDVATTIGLDTLNVMSGQVITALVVYIHRQASGPAQARQLESQPRSWLEYLRLFRAGIVIILCATLRKYKTTSSDRHINTHPTHLVRTHQTPELLASLYICFELLQEGCVAFEGLRHYKNNFQVILQRFGQLDTLVGHSSNLGAPESLGLAGSPAIITTFPTALDRNLVEATLRTISGSQTMSPDYGRIDSRIGCSVPSILDGFNFQEGDERDLYCNPY